MTRVLARAPHALSIAQAGVELRSGRLSATTLAQQTLQRIAETDDALHAFVLVTTERGLADAERADRELALGIDRGPLHGIPYALKDIYATAGIPTTCNSVQRFDAVPTEDAEVETRLRAGGGVLVGKLNTHEFAIGGPSTDLPFPPARNPWNTDYFTGGSSSGGGAAVAGGLVRVAFGSDTGGSIRSPASYCGIVGFKPTFGLVSRRGVFPLSYALDHCGPMTASVEDAALALQIVAGYDRFDPSSADVPVPDYRAALGHGVVGLRIGYARSFFARQRDVVPEVLSSMDAAAQTLARLGAVVVEVELPDFELFKACGRVIMIAEAFAIHEEALAMSPRNFARYTYQRLIAGATVTAADLTQAFRLRRELTLAVNHGPLSHFDVLITATTLTAAPRLDVFPDDWPPPAAASAVNTVPFNVSGNPALTVPCGLSATGLPLGMQIIGKPFDEAMVLQVAAAYEREFAFPSAPSAC